MKKNLLIGALLLAAVSVEAHQKFQINITAGQLTTESLTKLNTTFVQMKIDGFETDKTLGAPELPVKTWLIKGTPEQIKVQFKKNKIESIAGRPAPVQEQDCRCDTNKVKVFSYRADLYEKSSPDVQVNYLGAFRGQAISQVNVRLADYNAASGQVELVTNAEIVVNTSEFSLPRGGDNKDYLIVTTPQLADGVNDFVNWKRSRGYNVSVETVASPNNTTAAVQALIKQSYQKGADFVIIVGDESTIPMFRAATSGSAQTPSDLLYYTMDGGDDYVPDMYSSRIVASTAAQVQAQLAKSIEFEQRSFADASGLNKFIGIASNEGSKPSDDEYVTAIEAKYTEVLKSTIVHLKQNDAVNSKPGVLNSHFNSGAAWLTYLGHGSGTSWPSMALAYTTANIAQVSNKSVVKPIIIDVACQNGRLISANLGSQFMKVGPDANGAVAYYGGSVNISWHPPAVMAQGIAYEQLSKNYPHLGEALLAGQLYLAGKWANKAEVVDNMEWYHLQGDPGLAIGL